jgi:hypothetical protein
MRVGIVERRRLPAPLECDREPDRALEQQHEGNHLERRRDRVDSGQRHGGRGHDDVADPPVAAELRRRGDADPDEAEDEDRKLEDEPDGEQ